MLFRGIDQRTELLRTQAVEFNCFFFSAKEQTEGERSSIMDKQCVAPLERCLLLYDFIVRLRGIAVFADVIVNSRWHRC